MLFLDCGDGIAASPNPSQLAKALRELGRLERSPGFTAALSSGIEQG